MILIIVIVLVIEGVFACSIPGKRTKVNNCKMLGAEKLFRAVPNRNCRNATLFKNNWHQNGGFYVVSHKLDEFEISKCLLLSRWEQTQTPQQYCLIVTRSTCLYSLSSCSISSFDCSSLSVAQHCILQGIEAQPSPQRSSLWLFDGLWHDSKHFFHVIFAFVATTLAASPEHWLASFLRIVLHNDTTVMISDLK